MLNIRYSHSKILKLPNDSIRQKKLFYHYSILSDTLPVSYVTIS